MSQELAKIEVETIQVEITKREPKEESVYKRRANEESLLGIGLSQCEKPAKLTKPTAGYGLAITDDLGLFIFREYGGQARLKNDAREIMSRSDTNRLHLIKHIGNTKTNEYWKLLETWESKRTTRKAKK